MSEGLHIARRLLLPLDAVTEKFAFLGRTGNGKTYAATLLAEQMLDAGAQVVALDPVGVWWGLRLLADGATPGYAIPVFGGLHGDIPLEPTGGALIADVICDRSISAVLDVSQMIAAEQAKFARHFATRFFQRKKAAPSAVHVFIEEAQEFVPENVRGGGDAPHMVHAFERLIKLGRNFGVGASLISQRPQEVNKKALNQTECLFAFQMTGAHEREAIKKWTDAQGLEDQNVKQVLPTLEKGHPILWSPQWLKLSKVVAIRRKRTLDVSATPKVGAKAVAPQQLASVDLKKLQQDMAATIERAKAEDPKALRAEIGKLKRELQQIEQRHPEPVVKHVEVSVLKDEHITQLRDAVMAMVNAVEPVTVMGREITEALIKMRNGQRTRQRPAPRRPVVSRPPSRRSTPTRDQVADFSGELPKGERTILIAAAQHGEGVARNQLTVLTGYKRSTRDAYIQRLREKDFVFINLMGIVEATLSGISALGDDYEPLPTGLPLQEYWLGRLPEGERRILEIVIASWPGSAERSDIEEQTGYARSSRDAYIQRLKARRLVEITGPGEVCASENLF